MDLRISPLKIISVEEVVVVAWEMEKEDQYHELDQKHRLNGSKWSVSS